MLALSLPFGGPVSPGTSGSPVGPKPRSRANSIASGAERTQHRTWKVDLSAAVVDPWRVMALLW